MLSPLSSHTPAKRTGRQAIRYKANPAGRQAHREPTDRRSSIATTTAATHSHHQSGTYSLGSVLQIVRMARTPTRCCQALLPAGSAWVQMPSAVVLMRATEPANWSEVRSLGIGTYTGAFSAARRSYSRSRGAVGVVSLAVPVVRGSVSRRPLSICDLNRRRGRLVVRPGAPVARASWPVVLARAGGRVSSSYVASKSS